MRRTIAAIGAAAALATTTLAAPAQAYTINSNCGPWQDGNRACLTVRSTNISGPSARIENVKVCIEGPGYAQPADVRAYSNGVGAAEYPQKTGDCLHWGGDRIVPDDNLRVRSWGWMGQAGGPVTDFNVYVPVF